jgi:hypothetical protein
MAVNKVEYGGETLIDLTEDDVTPETLAEGVTAHGANGEKIVGILPIVDLNTLPTVDKVKSIDTWSEGVSELTTDDDGISWRDGFAFNNAPELEGDNIAYGDIHHRIPIVAGNGVEFENDGNVVKINATGGGSENVVSKFTVPTETSTTVVDMVTAIQNASGNIGEWNIINLTGHTTATFGLMISNYGGTVYNIQGTNLVDMTVISNTRDWSGVTLGAFTTMFQPVLPPCDDNNNEQFLVVVNGVPTWTTVPAAEGVGF